VVMDHKLAGVSEGGVEEIVATWAPQLALYATAIARVSGKPPVGTWLNLPQSRPLGVPRPRATQLRQQGAARDSPSDGSPAARSHFGEPIGAFRTAREEAFTAQAAGQDRRRKDPDQRARTAEASPACRLVRRWPSSAPCASLTLPGGRLFFPYLGRFRGSSVRRPFRVRPDKEIRQRYGPWATGPAILHEGLSRKEQCLTGNLAP
jgi:hypothetical protein